MNLRSKSFISLLILVIFHIIGLALFFTQPDASDLSWLNILLCGILLFINAGDYRSELVILPIIGLGGYFLELIGVKTGILFGDYAYDNALGIKVFEVPLMIAVNWYAIVIISCSLVRSTRVNIIFMSLLAAMFGVGIDYLIEPVAIKYDFWHWNTITIPLWNYICWFIALFVFSLIYFKIQKETNKIGISLFIIWFLFFLILNFV